MENDAVVAAVVARVAATTEAHLKASCSLLLVVTDSSEEILSTKLLPELSMVDRSPSTSE